MPPTVIDVPTALERLAVLLVALTSLTASQVLIGHGDMPRPTSAHLTLIPLADAGVGLPARDDDGDVAHARTVQVLLTAYGDTAVAALYRASTLLWSDAPEMFAAVADGLAIRAVGSVQDQTWLKSTSYEPRAGCTVTVGYVQVPADVDDPPVADQVRVAVNGTTDVIVEPEEA